MLVLEGADAVGKTSVINKLKDYNIIDRDKSISKLMDFNISIVERCKKIYEYLNNNDMQVIFLINNDKNEIERRINLRGKIDEFDKYAYLYNMMYYSTYLYMEKNNMLNRKLFMIDCTNLDIDEEYKKVKDFIDKEMENKICQI